MITAEAVARTVNELYSKSYVGDRIIDIAIEILKLILPEIDTKTLVHMYHNTGSPRLKTLIVRELIRRYKRQI